MFLCYAEPATEFATSLLQALMNEEPKVLSELQILVETLTKVSVVFYIREAA